MSKDQTLPDLPSVTFSVESGDGPSPSNSPVGLQLGLFGPAVSHASPSATPEAAGENPTSGTSGLSSSVSSRSANLQLSLENRLRQDLAVNGSPEFELTWKQWGMESGLPICALRASGHRISDSGSTGWPSPMAGTPANDRYNKAGNTDFSREVVALVTGWSSPVSDPANGTPEAFLERKRRAIEKGSSMGVALSDIAMVAQMVGWLTPRVSDTNGPGEHGDGGKDLRTTAGWATPQAIDAGKAREPRYKGDAPSEAGNTRDPNKAGSYRADSKDQVGQTQSGSPSETGSKGVLNPALPLWMMGYPIYWVQCAPQKRGRKRKV